MTSSRAADNSPDCRFGALIALIGILALAAALPISHRGSGKGDPGSRGFPLALSGLLIVSGLAVAIRPLLSSSKHSTEQSESPEQQPSAVVEPARSVAPIALLLITYIIAFPLLGYTFTTLALTWTQLLRSRQGLLRSTLVAIVLTIGVKLLFGRVFSVMLPEGLFESFL